MAEKKPFWPQWFRRKNAPAEDQEQAEAQEQVEVQELSDESESPLSGAPVSSAPEPEQPADQVSRAFEDLLGRYHDLLQEPAPTPSPPQPSTPRAEGYSELSRHLLGEAERQAATVKMRAVQEAEADAARIISEPKTQAQELLGQAQRKAHDDTRREVENILLSAQKKAKIHQDRAQQAAQLFLVRAREEVQSYVTSEAKEAYFKLMSSVQDVLGEAQSIEATWKNRTAELWGTTTFSLGDPSSLLDSLGPGESAPEHADLGAAAESATPVAMPGEQPETAVDTLQGEEGPDGEALLPVEEQASDQPADDQPGVAASAAETLTDGPVGSGEPTQVGEAEIRQPGPADTVQDGAGGLEPGASSTRIKAEVSLTRSRNGLSNRVRPLRPSCRSLPPRSGRKPRDHRRSSLALRSPARPKQR